MLKRESRQVSGTCMICWSCILETDLDTHTHTHTLPRKKAGYEVATPTQARQGQRGTPRRPNPQVHEKRTREEGNQGGPQNHHGTVSLSWTCVGWLKGSRPCSIQVRLVTAIRLTSNWCTSEPYQKPKERNQSWKTLPPEWTYPENAVVCLLTRGSRRRRMVFNTRSQQSNESFISLPGSGTP